PPYPEFLGPWCANGQTSHATIHRAQRREQPRRSLCHWLREFQRIALPALSPPPVTLRCGARRKSRPECARPVGRASPCLELLKFPVDYFALRSFAIQQHDIIALYEHACTPVGTAADLPVCSAADHAF